MQSKKIGLWRNVFDKFCLRRIFFHEKHCLPAVYFFHNKSSSYCDVFDVKFLFLSTRSLVVEMN